MKGSWWLRRLPQATGCVLVVETRSDSSCTIYMLRLVMMRCHVKDTLTVFNGSPMLISHVHVAAGSRVLWF